MSSPASTQAEAYGIRPAARLSPWQQIGAPVSECVNALHALDKAGLAGWNIRKLTQSATEITFNGATSITNPEKVMLVRDDPRTGQTRYLSTVGSQYGIRQNEDQATLLDALVAESGSTGFAHAGQLSGGKKTFVTMRLPDTMHIAGHDPVDLYLVVFNSHDGSSTFKVSLVPLRITCANQLGFALRNAVSSVSIQHRGHAPLNVDEIRNSLGLMYEYAREFEREAQKMIDTELTTADFIGVINELWPSSKNNTSVRAQRNAERRESELLHLWRDAPTQHGIRETRWGALQTIIEYLDHHHPAPSATVRATRVLTSNGITGTKQRAYDLLAV